MARDASGTRVEGPASPARPGPLRSVVLTCQPVCSLVVVFLLMTTAVAHANAAPQSLVGFPSRFGRQYVPKGLTIADLDGSGPVVVLAAGESVIVVQADGTVRPGFPIILRDPKSKTPVVFSAPPAVCDLDGDGIKEILLAGTTRKLHVITASGGIADGFPVQLDGKPRGPLTCFAQPGSRRHGIALTTNAGSLLVISGKGGKPRILKQIGRGAESGVAVSDLDRDGRLDFIAGGGDSRLYVVDAQGKTRRGFPYKMGFRTSGVPAIGDIDDDGKPEIIVGSQDF